MEQKEDKSPKTGLKAITIALFLIIFFLLGFFLITKTPRYSLYQIGRSVKQRDYEKFVKYVDIDSLIDNLVNSSTSDVDTSNAGIFSSLIPSLMESAKTTMKSQIRTYLEDGTLINGPFGQFTTSEIVFKTKINKTGKTAEVTITADSEIKLSMHKTEGIWRLSSINNLNDIQSTEERTITDVKPNTEVTLSTIKVKVNTAKKLSSIADTIGDAETPDDKNDVYIRVNITVENISDADIYIDGQFFNLSDSEKNQYEMYSPSIFSTDQNSLYGETIKSGLKKTGNIYFIAPKSASGFILPLSHKDKAEDYLLQTGI